LILAEKTGRGNINFFKLIQSRQILYEMLNFRKTMRFFLGAKSQLSTRHIWTLEKLYTIIEFIFCFSRMQHTQVTWIYFYTYMCTRKKSSASEHWTYDHECDMLPIN